MRVLFLLICLLSLTGCASLLHEDTPEEKTARANKTIFVHVENHVMIFRYNERGELIP